MNRMRDPRLSMYDVYECVNGKWEYAESIQAPSADAAAQEWIATRPQHTFRVRPAQRHKNYSKRPVRSAD
jgi:hypothetical protein